MTYPALHAAIFLIISGLALRYLTPPPHRPCRYDVCNARRGDGAVRGCCRHSGALHSKGAPPPIRFIEATQCN